MKIKLLIILIFPLCLNAQRSMRKYYELSMLNFNAERYYDDLGASLKLRKQFGIKEIVVNNTSKRGKESETHMSYNRQGRLLHSSSRNRVLNNTFLDDSLLVSTVLNRKGKVYETNNAYDNGKLSSIETFKNGKLESKTLISHNAQDKLTSSKLISGRKTYEVVNTYNDENKITKSVYLINGKVKKEWIYECKPEGQVVASKTEAISSSCSYREESADGSYTTFTRTLREGKPYLWKQTFNKDSVMTMSQRFMNDTILVWELKKENNVETTSSFSKSGKKIHTQISVFNANGNLLSREYFEKSKSKSRTKLVFELNENGTTKKKSHFHKGKRESSSRFECTYF